VKSGCRSKLFIADDNIRYAWIACRPCISDVATCVMDATDPDITFDRTAAAAIAGFAYNIRLTGSRDELDQAIEAIDV
jgi:hypothetical protein